MLRQHLLHEKISESLFNVLRICAVLAHRRRRPLIGRGKLRKCCKHTTTLCTDLPSATFSIWHIYTHCLFNSFRKVIWLECESKVSFKCYKHKTPLQMLIGLWYKHRRPLRKHRRPLRKHRQPLHKHRRPLLKHRQTLRKQRRPLHKHRQTLHKHRRPLCKH